MHHTYIADRQKENRNEKNPSNQQQQKCEKDTLRKT